MPLTLHTIRAPRGAHHRVKRIGRGNASGHGTTATRGTKGQRARQGGRKGLGQLGIKHFISHLPKVRGFRSQHQKPGTVTVLEISRFPAGTVVTLELMQQERMVPRTAEALKLIGGGKLLHALTVQAHAATPGARAAVAAAGGTVEIITEPEAPTKP